MAPAALFAYPAYGTALSPYNRGRSRLSRGHLRHKGLEGDSRQVLESAIVLERLSALAVSRETSVDRHIAELLQLVAESLDADLIHLTRLDGTTLHYDHVLDQSGMGLLRGIAVPVAQTYCAVLLDEGQDALVIEDAATDGRVAGLAATQQLGIRAYAGVPLRWADRHVYGTLCALYREPRRRDSGEVALLQLAARLIMQTVELAARAEAHRASEAQLRAIVAHAPVVLWALDAEGTITLSEGRALDALGFQPGELVGQSALDLFRAVSAALDHLRRALAGETLVATDDVRGRALETFYVPHVGGEGVIGVTVDVTERRQALHDALTGLPNRALFHARLSAALDGAQAPCAVLLLDLNGFKGVNDTWGHHAGDAALCAVAAHLREGVRGIDTVARLGGDEFGIVLMGTDRAGAVETAERLGHMAATPVIVDGQPLHIGLSIGIALSSDAPGDDGAALLRRADGAMYAAKRAGRVWAIDATA